MKRHIVVAFVGHVQVHVEEVFGPLGNQLRTLLRIHPGQERGILDVIQDVFGHGHIGRLTREVQPIKNSECHLNLAITR